MINRAFVLKLLFSLVLWSGHARADHLTFTNVTLTSAQVQTLLRVGRAKDATEAMGHLLKAWPEVHGIVGLTRIDPKVSTEAILYYASLSNEVEGTFLAPGHPPLDRPLARHPLIFARATTPPAVIFHEGLHAAIESLATAQPGRLGRVAVQAAWQKLSAKAGPGDEQAMVRLGLELVRRTVLEEVDVVRLTLRYRRELNLTADFIAFEKRHAAEQLRESEGTIQMIATLLMQSPRHQGLVDEVLALTAEVEAAACELAL